MEAPSIPLFPLQTVLVPGGRLPLKIFEPRYLDMVRDCARDASGFGVCLLLPGASGENPNHHARTGTLARINDFYTLEDGLLGITTEGAGRFRIRRTSVRDNGLMIARVAWMEEPPLVEVPAQFGLLAEMARRLMDEVGENYPSFETGSLDDANWLGYRLTELLPLENIEKQVLLEITDPFQRLQRLLEALPRLQQPDAGE